MTTNRSGRRRRHRRHKCATFIRKRIGNRMRLEPHLHFFCLCGHHIRDWRDYDRHQAVRCLAGGIAT